MNKIVIEISKLGQYYLSKVNEESEIARDLPELYAQLGMKIFNGLSVNPNHDTIEIHSVSRVKPEGVSLADIKESRLSSELYRMEYVLQQTPLYGFISNPDDGYIRYYGEQAKYISSMMSIPCETLGKTKIPYVKISKDSSSFRRLSVLKNTCENIVNYSDEQIKRMVDSRNIDIKNKISEKQNKDIVMAKESMDKQKKQKKS